MSNGLSEMDRELLGEVSYNNGGEAAMAKANGGSGSGALEGSYGTSFTPLNATAGTLIKVSSNGDEVEPGLVSFSVLASLTPTLPAIFCFLRTQLVLKHPHFVLDIILPKIFTVPHILDPFSSCNFAINFLTPKFASCSRSQPHCWISHLVKPSSLVSHHRLFISMFLS